MSMRAPSWRRPLAAGAMAALALAGAGCEQLEGAEQGADANSATVDYVLDGDTINVTTSDGQSQRVRLLGINTPEVAHEGQSAQCGGEEAAAQLEKLLPEGAKVKLVHDSRADDEDRYGRLLRYVETTKNDTDSGAQLIEDGYAYAWKPRSEPQPSRWNDYKDASAQAEDNGTGSWSTCPNLGDSR